MSAGTDLAPRRALRQLVAIFFSAGILTAAFLTPALAGEVPRASLGTPGFVGLTQFGMGVSRAAKGNPLPMPS
jgi:hypothetical protein